MMMDSWWWIWWDRAWSLSIATLSSTSSTFQDQARGKSTRPGGGVDYETHHNATFGINGQAYWNGGSLFECVMASIHFWLGCYADSGTDRFGRFDLYLRVAGSVLHHGQNLGGWCDSCHYLFVCRRAIPDAVPASSMRTVWQSKHARCPLSRAPSYRITLCKLVAIH